MRKLWIAGLIGLLLAGCSSRQTLETVDDEWITPVMASPATVSVDLPEDAVAPVLDMEGQQVYLCEGYEIFLENRQSGDLGATIQYLTGFDKDALTVMQTSQGSCDRYEFVWTCAGENGQRLGRGVILDDGSYHYCMCIVRDELECVEEKWQDVFASFCLV